MLQHVEFEVYVNKYHIWFQKKKHIKQSVVTIIQ